MKKIALIVAALVFGVVTLGGASAQAQAQPDCDILIINGTGSGSNNLVTCTTNVTVTVECVNNIYVLDTNSQTAISGAAIVGGNVTGGTAVTGNATNVNNQTVQIGASCGQTITPITTTPQITPSSSVTPTPAAVPAQKVTALPFTASHSIFELVVISSVIIVTLLISARFAVVAYRQAVSKQ